MPNHLDQKARPGLDCRSCLGPIAGAPGERRCLACRLPDGNPMPPVPEPKHRLPKNRSRAHGLYAYVSELLDRSGADWEEDPETAISAIAEWLSGGGTD